MIRAFLGNSADIFGVVGALVSVVLAFRVSIGVFRFITSHFLAKALGLSANLKNAGSWAVVTGCTDGIGKAYAEQLAARGLNIVLLSRTMSKLEDLAKELGDTYQVETKVIAVDFSSGDIYDEIKLKLTGLDIGVLVNNVGCSYDHPEYFTEVDEPDMVRKMINMNCSSVAKMTEIVLPSMVTKQKGYVINIGSSAGTYPTPLLALYSGTKSFVRLFTKSLQGEYANRGVTFQCIRPYFVVSKLSKFKKPSLFVPSPTTFVKAALNTVGLLGDTTGYWPHELQNLFMYLVPPTRMMAVLNQARARALKKKAMAKSQMAKSQ